MGQLLILSPFKINNFVLMLLRRLCSCRNIDTHSSKASKQ